MRTIENFSPVNPSMATNILMDGDRYKLTIPDFSMKDILDHLLEADEDLFLDKAPGCFPMKRKNMYAISCPYYRYGDKKPRFEHMAIWVDYEKTAKYDDNVSAVRPVLMPVDKNGKFDPAIIADEDGTYVSGGTLYSADKFPTPHSMYGSLTLTAGTSIGDTRNVTDPDYTLDWVVVQNMLVSRYAIFIANGKTLLESGLVW